MNGTSARPCSRRSTRLLLVVALVLVVGAPRRRIAAEEITDVTEYEIGEFLNDIDLGSDGNLWASSFFSVQRILSDGSHQSYAAPFELQGPTGIAAGPDGRLWLSVTKPGKLARLSTGGVFDDLDLLLPTRRADTHRMTAGDDGNFWFLQYDTENGTRQIGRMTPDGVASEFTLDPNDVYLSIARGPDDGNVWFSGFDSLGRITPSGMLTQFPFESFYGGSLAAGEDGELWLVNAVESVVGRATTGGQVRPLEPVFGRSAVLGATLGPEGNLWMYGLVFFDDQASSTSYLWRVTPKGNLTEFDDFANPGTPAGIAADLAGNLWVASGQHVAKVQALHFTQRQLPAASRPESVGRGGDGSIWFTAPGKHLVGRIDPLGGTVQLPIDPKFMPFAISGDTAGNGWFTDPNRNSVSRITPAGVVTEFPLATADAFPQDIAAGIDGEMWFTEFNASQIARIDADGEVTEFPTLTPSANPQGIDVAADGTVWFTERGANKIGRRSVAGEIDELPIETEGSGPFDISVAADGSAWFSEYNGAQIAHVTPEGTIVEFPAPRSVENLVAAGDGAAWFGDPESGRLWRLTARGRLSKFDLPAANARPLGIAYGPQGDLFLALNTADRIVTTHLVAADPYRAQCLGDCSASGQIDENDIRLGTSIALGTSPPMFCPSMRRLASGTVRVDHLVRAVADSLGPCR